MNLVQDFQDLFSFQSLISLLTLSVLEVVLGIDNIIFISIVAGRLPRSEQQRARTIGLLLALIMRVALLFSISWIIGLKNALFTIQDFGVTGRDLILFAGGVFLLIKTTQEIHHKVEGKDEETNIKSKSTLNAVVAQIVLIDIVFSFDSILTAVGLVTNVLLMILAVIIALIIMLIFSGKVSDFINKHPTVKILALAFLLMIAIILILDAAHMEVDTIKPYIYFSMAFSFFVELLNMRMHKKKKQKEN